MLDVRMIAGLGNVGSEYTGTRHNVGFEVVDLLAGRLGVDVKKRKFGGLFGETVFCPETSRLGSVVTSSHSLTPSNNCPL